MIIDLILDRKEMEEAGFRNAYDSKEFYDGVLQYQHQAPENVDEITSAMDSGTEEDVKIALKTYIDDGDYNPKIKDWIDKVSWLGDEE